MASVYGVIPRCQDQYGASFSNLLVHLSILFAIIDNLGFALQSQLRKFSQATHLQANAMRNGVVDSTVIVRLLKSNMISDAKDPHSPDAELL